MANHYEIKPDENGLALRMAMKALRSANSQATANPGSIYIPNGDGTGTLIGSQASDGAGGLAPFVGDTTPPGKPTGVSATSTWGVIYASWDGTLEGGIPADFAYVSITIDGNEVAQMVKAGTLTSQGWENGTLHTIGFTAYDSARDSVGNLVPNASETVEVSVTVSDERAEIDAKVDAAEKAANKAAQDAQEAWDKAEQQAQAVADAAEKAQQAADKADQAMSDLSETADELTGQITQVTTKVNGVEQDVEELSTSVSGAVKTAEGALTTATEAKQTAEGVSATATQALTTAQGALNKAAEVEITANGLSTQVTAAMDTATDALNKAAEVEVTADGIQADLTKNYVSKTDAANTYATKASLSATAEGLQADISEVTTTAEGALEKANSLEVTAEGLRADLTETTTTAGSALKKANATEVTVNGMKQTLTETTNTANSALNKSTSLETSVNGIKTQVDSVSKTANSALSKASAAQQDITGFKTTVSNTYETKKDADAAMAQEVLDRNSAITQKANQILSEVKSNYVDKTTGQTYASKTYVDQREDAILQAVETEYQSKDGMSSYYTKTQIDQQKDSIESSISVAVDNIDIGAKNMLRESDIPNRSHSPTSYPAASYPIQGGVISGEQYTWTVRGTFTNATKMAMYFTGGTYGTGWVAIPGNGTHTIHLTFTAGPNMANNDSRADFFVRDSRDSPSFNGTAVITWAKLEKGNKSTDWSPAPEDVETELTSIRQDLDSIDLKVADLDGNQSDFQVTVDGFEARLETAETNATTAKNNASTALDTANTANSTASSAKTTATNAQNTANTAKSTADSAKITATTANNNATSALNRVTLKDTRDTNQNPQWYFTNYPRQLVQEFKKSSAIGLPAGTYCYLMTYVPWADSSGGWPKQTAKVDGTGKEYWRVGTSSTAWSAWVDAYGTATNAAKTATNYLSFSSGGLVVGTNSGGTGQSGLQGNVRLYSGGMEVRNGTTVLARYGASTIELGINSQSSRISLCGGVGNIRSKIYNSDSNLSYLDITGSSDVRIGTRNSSYYVNESKPHIAVTQHGAGMYSGKASISVNDSHNLIVGGTSSDGRSNTFGLSLFKFGMRMDTQTLWTGNLGKNGTGTLKTGNRFDDWRIFAIRLGADNIFLTGLRHGNQIHASNGTDDGKSSYTYVCQITVTSETTFKYVSGSSHKITAIDSAMEDKALNLSEIVGVC